MPAFALGATRSIVTRGIGAATRAYAVIALVAGMGLVALTRWLPAPLDLTPAEKAAIPPTAVALGLVVLLSAVLVRDGALRGMGRLTIAGYAIVVAAIPFVSGPLLAAVGEDRSSAAVAGAAVATLAPAGDAGAALPLLAADNHYAAYGPCRPHPLTPDAKSSPSPQRGEGAGG